MQLSSKYTVICLSVLAALVSCSESDMPSMEQATDKYIVFGTPSIDMDGSVGGFTGNETRANVTLVSSVDKFNVWAYCIPNSIKGFTGDVIAKDEEKASTPWIDKSKFFTTGADVENLANTTVTPTGTFNYNQGNLTNGKLTKWNDNSDALYTFIGVAGQRNYTNYDNKNVNNFEYKMENASATSGSEHGPRLTITLNQNYETKTEEKPGKYPWSPKEIITTITGVDRETQADPVLAAAFDWYREKGKVKLSFSHIMTALRFKIQNFADKKLTITSIKFNGKFYKKATIDFTSLSPEMTVDVNETYEGPINIIDENQESYVEVESDNAKIAGGDDNYLLLLPYHGSTTNVSNWNNVLGNGLEISITYKFQGDRNDRTHTIPVTLNYQPQPNTKHTAYLNFVGDNFYVTFQADGTTWENGSDNEYTIQ